MKTKIQRGIPIPPKRDRETKYPFKQMKPGESFVIPVEGGKSANRTQSNGLVVAHRQGFKGRVTSRISEDEKSVRFWLVK